MNAATLILLPAYPRGAQRPLLRDIGPGGQVLPVEVNVEGLQQSTHHVDDVHETAHAPWVHVREVVVSQEHSVNLG